jgi:hypothetical protein
MMSTRRSAVNSDAVREDEDRRYEDGIGYALLRE